MKQSHTSPVIKIIFQEVLLPWQEITIIWKIQKTATTTIRITIRTRARTTARTIGRTTARTAIRTAAETAVRTAARTAISDKLPFQKAAPWSWDGFLHILIVKKDR